MCHARERLVNIGIRPSVNCSKTRICFRITRLMNNQIKGRRKATCQKEEKVKTKALSIAKSVSQLGCVSQDSDARGSQGTKEFW